MDAYRQLVGFIAATAVDPLPTLRDQQRRMSQAAAELNFESAGKIKQFIEQLGQLAKGSFACARRLEDFQYLALQAGPHANTAKAFLILPGLVQEVSGLIGPPTSASALLGHLFGLANRTLADPPKKVGSASRLRPTICFTPKRGVCSFGWTSLRRSRCCAAGTTYGSNSPRRRRRSRRMRGC
ncbi:MAG: UvrB/UvrC motif-containing protein [Verrucomicrobiota bacterium]